MIGYYNMKIVEKDLWLFTVIPLGESTPHFLFWKFETKISQIFDCLYKDNDCMELVRKPCNW